MKSRTQIGWLELLIGLAFAALGVLTLMNPSTVLTTLVVVYGIAAIVGGIFDVIYFFRMERKAGFEPIMLLVSGLLSIAVGVLLLFFTKTGGIAAGILFAIWFIIRCVARLMNLGYVKEVSGTAYFWLTLVVNVIGVIIGIMLLFNPVTSAITMVDFIGIYLLILGIGAAIAGISFLASRNDKIEE